MKTTFKSVRPIEIRHERGTDFIQVSGGTVIKEENGRVYLKGMMYDFNISKEDFEKHNIASK